MSVRKIGKILLYGASRGCWAWLLLLMLAVKLALDRAPAYQAEIKQWVHAQTGYHIAFARVSPSFRWYGPELHFDRLELRSKDDRAGAGARRRRPRRRRHLAADQQRQTAGRQDRTRFAEHRHRAPGSDELCPGLRDQIGRRRRLARQRSLWTICPPASWSIRHAVVTMQNWNSALPQLTLQDVNLDVRRGDERLVGRLQRPDCRRRSAEP